MSLENSKQRASIESTTKKFTTKDTTKMLKDLQEILNLPRFPKRIECYDISNISGTNSVASMSVFNNGNPSPHNYRKFKIKSVQGINDYAMIKEVLERRFKSISQKPGEITPESQNQQQLSEIPDLVLIDGGKGHLSTAVQVFLELGINNVPLASIAKQNEEIFIPNFSEPVEFSSNPESLNILQKIRDEAHRFAINYHRKLRSKTALFSSIDTIPGIGPKKRKSILNKFGSIKNINKSSIEEITKIPGISEKLAKQLLSISKNMQ